MAHFPIDPDYLEWYIKAGLAEDVGPGDYTSMACIPADRQSQARLLCKDKGVLAGVKVAERIFSHVDPLMRMEVFIRDGEEVGNGDIAFEVTASTRALLMAERLVLNTMQRLSGIATMSRAYASFVSDLPVKILDTRKTTPLLRPLEKWAVHTGGCVNYRYGLFDWFMIKDNHVEASGGIREAIRAVSDYKVAHRLNLPLTVEVRTMDELQEAMEVGGFQRVMLDNFDVREMADAVAYIDGKCEVEASGGITLESLRSVAETGVDFISTGALTHSSKSLDLSLKIIKSS